MSIVVRSRMFVARHPWIHWATVVLLTTIVIAVEVGRVNDLEAARDRWGSTTAVLVATREHVPGDEVVAEWRDLPDAVIPPTAVTDPPAHPTLRRAITTGEVVVEADLVDEPGPAGHLDDGRAIVPISDPLLTVVEVGARVAVYADGITLADEATVVVEDGDIVYVAVDRRDAPMVAAAAQSRIASVVYVD
jgi:hypothetical protein